MAGETVVVAMSGGVDSSVAAALLAQQGYQVIGLMVRLWAERGPAANRCCTPDAVAASRQVAAQLDIPFYVRDYRDTFKRTVVDYFVATYAAGRTPNPCILCNELIRFGQLLEEAWALGATRMATGHYARVQPPCGRGEHAEGRHAGLPLPLPRTTGGEYQLLKGVDPAKDQSYVLHRLTQAQLAHVIFPLGDYVKSDVRRIARQARLSVFDRPDSQDLCFLGDGDYRAFLAHHAPELLQPGPLLDTAGSVLGQHRGLAFYTVGQRRGLGITSTQPMYVVQLDAARNTITVGSVQELGRSELVASQVNYISRQAPDSPMSVTTKIRYKAAEVPAVLTPLPGGRAHLRFNLPLRDITPGQAAVFYQGEVVIGGGFID